MGNEKNCEKWLEEFLSENGKTLTDVVKNIAKLEGFTKSKLNSARKKLDVLATNNFDKTKATTTEWYWELKK